MNTSEPQANMTFSKAIFLEIQNSADITAAPLGYRFGLVIGDYKEDQKPRTKLRNQI
jgi:hypothetical protein